MTTKEVIAQGGIEKIGLKGSFLKLTLPNGEKKVLEKDIPEHTIGVEFILNTLISPEYGAIKSLDEINAVGHRMVHGGERFSESVLLNKEVLEAFAACNDLAPLHNPANLKGATNIFKQFTKNTVGKFTRIKFTKNGTIRKITGIAAIISIMAGTTACGNRTEAVITDNNEDITSYKEYATVEESKASKFQYTDLTINSLKYMMTEAAVKNIYGTPVSEYESTEKDSNANAEYSEKVCSYNDLTLIFVKFTDDGRTAGKNENGTYKLTAAASVSDKDVFSRGLKVGMSVDSILSVYYRDKDYKNNYYTSDDSTAVLGKYLYGSFTLDELDKVNTKDAIAYGLINFNGYDSDETADNYIIEFTYFAPDYKNGTASVDDDFAQIAFDIDNNGVITAIRWYYYPQQ